MSLLDTQVPEINAPVLKPTNAPKASASSSKASSVSSKMGEWYNWLVHHVPKTIRKRVTVAFRFMKNKVLNLYNTTPNVNIPESWEEEIRQEEEQRRQQQDELQPELVMESIDGNVKKYIITPGENTTYDAFTFLMTSAGQVVDLFRGKTVKVKTAMVCELEKFDPKTGDTMVAVPEFWSKMTTILPGSDANNEYSKMRERMLENLAKYQKRGSNRQFQLSQRMPGKVVIIPFLDKWRSENVDFTRSYIFEFYCFMFRTKDWFKSFVSR